MPYELDCIDFGTLVTVNPMYKHLSGVYQFLGVVHDDTEPKARFLQINGSNYFTLDGTEEGVGEWIDRGWLIEAPENSEGIVLEVR